MTNPIIKAHLEGVEMFDNQFPPFVGIGAQFPIFKDTPNREHIKSFLTTYGINLLKAAKEAGLKERMKKDFRGTFPGSEENIGWNDCLTSFHSAIDEGIEGIEGIEKGEK